MVQQKVQFDHPFGAAEMSPVEHRQTQIDHGGIHADQFVLEPELLLPETNLTPASLK